MTLVFLSLGQYCAEDVNECLMQPNACHNGGTCFNTIGGHTCVCVNGWTGEDCSENIDDCATAVCFNGATCHDRVASFFCECPVGKTGTTVFNHSLFVGFVRCAQNHILLSLQVCSVIWMMLVSVTPAMRGQCVTLTLWMAAPSAPALLALLVEPATKTWMNVPLVNILNLNASLSHWFFLSLPIFVFVSWKY